MILDFGKNHWLLFGVSFFGFIALAYVVGIGLAIWVQNHSQPLSGSVAPTCCGAVAEHDSAHELRTGYFAAGGRTSHHAIEAYDDLGVRGTRTIDFSVRNGPGIAVAGIRQHDVLDGKIPVIVNAYGGTTAVNREPSQAETPAPAPTWPGCCRS